MMGRQACRGWQKDISPTPKRRISGHSSSIPVLLPNASPIEKRVRHPPPPITPRCAVLWVPLLLRRTCVTLNLMTCPMSCGYPSSGWVALITRVSSGSRCGSSSLCGMKPCTENAPGGGGVRVLIEEHETRATGGRGKGEKGRGGEGRGGKGVRGWLTAVFHTGSQHVCLGSIHAGRFQTDVKHPLHGAPRGQSTWGSQAIRRPQARLGCGD